MSCSQKISDKNLQAWLLTFLLMINDLRPQKYQGSRLYSQSNPIGRATQPSKPQTLPRHTFFPGFRPVIRGGSRCDQCSCNLIIFLLRYSHVRYVLLLVLVIILICFCEVKLTRQKMNNIHQYVVLTFVTLGVLQKEAETALWTLTFQGLTFLTDWKLGLVFVWEIVSAQLLALSLILD